MSDRNRYLVKNSPKLDIDSFAMKESLKQIRARHLAQWEKDERAADLYLKTNVPAAAAKVIAALYNPHAQWDGPTQMYVEVSFPDIRDVRFVSLDKLADAINEFARADVPWIKQVRWTTGSNESATFHITCDREAMPAGLKAVSAKSFDAAFEKAKKARFEKQESLNAETKRRHEEAATKREAERAEIKNKFAWHVAKLQDLARVPENWECNSTKKDSQPTFTYQFGIWDHDNDLRTEFLEQVCTAMKGRNITVERDDKSRNVFGLRLRLINNLLD